jgi:hypothetical protein
VSDQKKPFALCDVQNWGDTILALRDVSARAASASIPLLGLFLGWMGIHMIDPAPELPDDTPVNDVVLPSRIRNGLTAAGFKTVGEVRQASDAMLVSLPDLGRRSVAYLRDALGLPSSGKPLHGDTLGTELKTRKEQLPS